MWNRRFGAALVLVLVLVAGACGSDSNTSSGPSETATTVAALDPDIVARIDAEIAAWMAEGTPPVPGATVAVLLPDGQEIITTAGVRDLKTSEPVTSDDYFRIGSVSKTITSALVLQLVEEGKVSLDEPVATYLGDDWITGYELNGVDYAGDVTVRDVIGHTDGFAEFAWDPGFYVQTGDRLDQAYEPQELLDWGAAQKPLFPPGTDYEYNTVGHVAAGLVIEAVTGNPAHEELNDRILAPLGLENTFLPPGSSPPVEVVHGYAVGELLEALKLLPQTAQYQEQGTVGANGEYFDMLTLPQEAIRSAGWTGGGIEAQLADVAAIFRAMFDGTLLNEESLTSLTTPNAFSGNYGLGIEVDDVMGHTAYEKGGGVPGFRTYAGYFPDLDIAIAISVNAVPASPDVDELAERILKILTEGDANTSPTGGA